jgi:hypothetical protein
MVRVSYWRRERDLVTLFLRVEVLNLGSVNNDAAQLRLTWVVMGLNETHFRCISQGPPKGISQGICAVSWNLEMHKL